MGNTTCRDEQRNVWRWTTQRVAFGDPLHRPGSVSVSRLLNPKCPGTQKNRSDYLEAMTKNAIFAVDMRPFLCLTIFLLALFPMSGTAQEPLQGRVVDAETGEPLPYVSIFAGEGRRTLTNAEGDFKLEAEEGDALTFSCVGYKKARISAGKLPTVVRLKPYTTVMQEVTVQAKPYDEVLKQMIENLKQDYRWHGDWVRKYFFRTMMEKAEGTYIAEAFVRAYSVLNLREVEIISGLQGYDKDADKGKLGVNASNVHRLIEVGPLTAKSSFWSSAQKPLQHYSYLREYYDTQFRHLQDDEGNLIYRIDFSLKEKYKEEFSANKPYITGTAYVDAGTCRLLRFDGSCKNYYMKMELIPYPTSIDFQLEYDYSKGAASVSHLVVSGGNALLTHRSLLFAIEGDKRLKGKKKGSGSNIVTALTEAGYDASLWSKYDIVRRTEEEERVAFGK